MDSVSYILNGIRKIRFRLCMNKILKCGMTGGAVGFLAGFSLNFASIWIPLSYSVFYGAIFGVFGIAAGICCSFFHLPDLKKAALAGDFEGLQESLITALERREMTDPFSLLQREQTASILNGFDYRRRIPIRLPWKPFCVMMMALSGFLLCAAVPSPAKNTAIMKKEQREMLKAQKGEIERVKEEIKNEAALEEIQKESLEKLLDMALEELNKLDPLMMEMDKVMERLDTKLEKEEQIQEDPAFTQTVKGISEDLRLPSREKRQAADEELKKALLEELKNEIEKSGEQMTGKETEELSEKLGKALSGEGAGEALEELSQLSGLSKEELDEMFQKASVSMGKKGQEKKDLSKQDEGGQDGTQNQGDKSGFVKADTVKSSPEELNIPDRVLGTDENITGSASDGDSYTIQSESGPAWSGQKTGYTQVIGEYTYEACHKIDQSSVPEPVKDMVKDYFSGLNE